MPASLARGGLAALALLALAGCGTSSRESRKNAVNEYITRVNTAEEPLLGQAGQIDLTLGRFSLAHNSPAEVAALVRAHSAIADALQRVRAISPPPGARALHAAIVELLSRQEAVAADLVRAVRYGPELDRALSPLRGAASRLGRDLAAIKASAPSSTPAATGPTGAQIWTAAGCGACHTLAASGSNGASGPDLDQARPASSLIANQVRTGGAGMPSYAGSLSGAQLNALADYVAAASRGTAAPAPSGSASIAAENAALASEYAAAFERYRRALQPVTAAVSRLRAPALLLPGLRAERHALARSVTLSGAIATAFSHQRVAAADTAIKSLFGTVSGVSATKVRREQNAAARTYNARLAEIKKLTTRIATERQKLVAEVG